MAFQFDLWNRDNVFNNAQVILIRLSSTDCMPPAEYGGPWPQEWIDLFRRWVDAGGPVLERGKGQYTATRNAAGVRVQAKVTTPTPGYHVWMEEDRVRVVPPAIVVYAEPPDPPQAPAPEQMEVRDTFEIPATETTVRIIDADGPHDVSIT
jgi:hypothetical protein